MDIFRLGRMLMDVDRALYQQANTPRQDQSTNRCYSEEQVFIQQACVCVERPAGHTHNPQQLSHRSPLAPSFAQDLLAPQDTEDLENSRF